MSERAIKVAFEDVCAALEGDLFGSMVQDSNEILEREIWDNLEKMNKNVWNYAEESEDENQTSADKSDDELPPGVPSTGVRAKIICLTDNCSHSGAIVSIHRGQLQILYDERDVEMIKINGDSWRFCLSGPKADVVFAADAFEQKSSGQIDL